MNQAPFLAAAARGSATASATRKLIDATVHDGLWCAIEDCHMGTHAERVAINDARQPRRTRTRSRWQSHQQAIAAIDAGPVRRRAGAGHRPRREGPRDGRRRSTRARAATRRIEALARLKPAFALPDGRGPRRRHGRARSRPATRPGITDGAAATVVASERAVERLGLKPLARIVGYAQAEVAPKWLFLAPVEGVRRLLDRIELPIEAFDLIEINEAFAAQTLADGRELGFDWDKVNVNGGAIALGHPIGASGARIVATLLHELRRREGRYGLATLCLGGGGSVAMAFERVCMTDPRRRA